MLTLPDLLISLRNRLQAAIEQKDEETQHRLAITFDEMLEASYSSGHREFCVLLEDLNYAINHIRIAPWKADIPTDEQIYAAFASNDEKPEQE